MQLSIPPRIKNFSGNISLILWVLFFILLTLEAVTLKHSIRVLLYALHSDPGAQPVRSVLINTDAYKAAVDRIVRSETFVPEEVTAPNPFLPPSSSVSGEGVN